MASSRAQQAAIAVSMKKAGKKPKSLTKAQKVITVKPTADSTDYYTSRMLSDMNMSFRSSGDTKKYYDLKVDKDVKDLNRQKLKGKPGYDKNGFPIKKTITKKKG